jgi:hypothetical protein
MRSAWQLGIALASIVLGSTALSVAWAQGQRLAAAQLAGTWKYETGPGMYIVTVTGTDATFDWTRSQTYGRDTLTCSTRGTGPIKGVAFTAAVVGGCKAPSLNTDGMKARGTCTLTLMSKDTMSKNCVNEEGGRSNHTLLRVK